MARITIHVFLFLLLRGMNTIIVNNGGYEDVYIYVQETNDESGFLLKRIKEVFADASKLMFTATRQRLYFKKIRIVVPKSWSLKSIKHTKKSVPSLYKQYIVVDKEGMKVPHVRGLNKCGGEGNYMYLPAEDFVLKKGKTNWGQVIVHEWGHLRWGLFDEYPVHKPYFYQANGTWKPVSCTEHTLGRLVKGQCSSDGEECNTDDTSRKMDKNCKFCPDISQSLNASLMSYSNLNKVSLFCDKSDPSVHQSQWHNRLATNMQNDKCRHRSAWEVMRMHKDFQDNLDTLPLSTDTTPKFEIIQASEKCRVFVLDVSGSMAGERLLTLHKTAKYVIQEVIAQGSWLGIVVFSSNASMVKDLTKINSASDREELVEALPTHATGSTCIGCGIQEAISILKSRPGNANNAEIIVISDGENTDGDPLLSVQEAILKKIAVYTIAVTQQADTVLANISRETGGKQYTYLEHGTITFADSFSEIITDDITSAKSHRIMILSEKLNSVQSYSVQFSFAIENGIGSDTSITVITNSNQDLNIEVVGPNNFSQSLNTSGNYATLSFPGVAMAGLYEAKVSMNQSNQTLEYYVKSWPTSDDFVKITSWLSTTNVDLLTDELPAVFVDVQKGFAPVINANVSARVESDENSCELFLADNGIDPDVMENDGVYSKYLPLSCLSYGRVNVKGYIRGTAGKTKRIKQIFGAPGIAEVDEEPEIFNEDFQRVQVMEELYVTNYNDQETRDIIAPGRITDVDIYNIVSKMTKYGESRNFTITWTATGDDKAIGQAAAYIIRISDDLDTLLDNFDSADLLELGNVTLTPQEAGTTEALKIVVDAEESYTKTAFFALKAVDEAGNAGEVSNIVPIVVANGYRAAGEKGSLDIEKVDTFDTSVAGGSDKSAVICWMVGRLGFYMVLILVAMVVV